MGGYVAAVAAETIQPAGLFLIAPALYLPRYRNQNPQPRARLISVVHGWRDELVPVQNSLRFGRDHGAVVHLFDGNHGLANHMPEIARFFGLFLDQVEQVL